jgi:hypothetical protein
MMESSPRFVVVRRKDGLRIGVLDVFTGTVAGFILHDSAVAAATEFNGGKDTSGFTWTPQSHFFRDYT